MIYDDIPGESVGNKFLVYLSCSGRMSVNIRDLLLSALMIAYQPGSTKGEPPIDPLQAF